MVTFYQETQVHFFNQRWPPLIDEIANILYSVDPVAKACMPTYYTTVINSYEYGVTFKNTHRVPYNVIYNLPQIYRKSYEISD